MGIVEILLVNPTAIMDEHMTAIKHSIQKNPVII